MFTLAHEFGSGEGSLPLSWPVVVFVFKRITCILLENNFITGIKIKLYSFFFNICDTFILANLSGDISIIKSWDSSK